MLDDISIIRKRKKPTKTLPLDAITDVPLLPQVMPERDEPSSRQSPLKTSVYNTMKPVSSD
jgi:hypothetical protein